MSGKKYAWDSHAVHVGQYDVALRIYLRIKPVFAYPQFEHRICYSLHTISGRRKNKWLIFICIYFSIK